MRLNFPDNSFIEADVIRLGREFQIGKNVHIKVRGQFKIGDFGRFGDDVEINAKTVDIGNHFFHYTPGLNIGGGGSQFPYAVLRVGDRCVLHDNYINIARSVVLGNDVGLSPGVEIITHGFWNSILEGYPTKYADVFIADGVIIGQRSMILSGCNISKNIVIGANSTVTENLSIANSIYAGNPAVRIRSIVEPSIIRKQELMREVIENYQDIAGKDPMFIYDYPHIYLDDVMINVQEKWIKGEETIKTDKLRDFLRRYGIRIYTERPFVSL